MPSIHEFFEREQVRRNPYRLVWAPDHPRASSSGQVYEHIAVAEAIIGHYLPDGAQIHHVDGDPRNNTLRNLVVCEDSAYHKLLHQRARVIRAGGNPNTQLVCGVCGCPKDQDQFHWDDAAQTKRRRRCKDCSRASARQWRRVQKIVRWAEEVEF